MLYQKPKVHEVLVNRSGVRMSGSLGVKAWFGAADRAPGPNLPVVHGHRLDVTGSGASLSDRVGCPHAECREEPEASVELVSAIAGDQAKWSW